MDAIGSDNAVTYTEVHAAILGATVGAIVAFLFASGFRTVAVGLTVAVVGIALGLGAHGRVPIARRTLRREPWYGLAAFLVAGAIVLVATGRTL